MTARSPGLAAPVPEADLDDVVPALALDRRAARAGLQRDADVKVGTRPRHHAAGGDVAFARAAAVVERRLVGSGGGEGGRLALTCRAAGY
ncbi:hypothetical protein GCM10009734_24990 [Nonomuraea bangladeshensis]